MTTRTTRTTGTTGDPSSQPSGKLFGLSVALISQEQAVARLSAHIEQRRANPDAQQRVWQVVTLNPEIAMRAQRDDGLRAIIQRAALVTPDGVGIALALRWRGYRTPARVTGVDLVEALAARAAQDGWRLFLLGAQAGVAEAAAEALIQRHPGLIVTGTHAGSPEPADDAETLARLHAGRPDLLCVAYGSPAQEVWIARHSEQLAGVVALGVGGAFDFLAGRVPRAPQWMRRVGLEWLFRLLRQPWRWRRMLALPRFALDALLERET